MNVLQGNCLEDLIVRNGKFVTASKETSCFSTSLCTNWSRVRVTQVTVGIRVRVCILGDTCSSTPYHPTNNQLSTNQPIESINFHEQQHHQNEFNEQQQQQQCVELS